MATVKGAYHKDYAHITVLFTLHLKNDPDVRTVGQLLEAVRLELASMCIGLDEPDIIGNADMFSHALRGRTLKTRGEWGDSVDIPMYVSQIDIAFDRDRREGDPDLDHEEKPVVTIATLETPKPQTAEDKIREEMEQKVIGVLAVANTTKELLERYAPQMAEDPELREALMRLLENERIKQFDQGTGGG